MYILYQLFGCSMFKSTSSWLPNRPFVGRPCTNLAVVMGSPRHFQVSVHYNAPPPRFISTASKEEIKKKKLFVAIIERCFGNWPVDNSTEFIHLFDYWYTDICPDAKDYASVGRFIQHHIIVTSAVIQ